jgi:drug/metabolite transporter (DMT)-like permease
MGPVPPLSPQELHDRIWALFSAYTAFIAALLLALVNTSRDDVWARKAVISLLALALPSLVAFLLLDWVVRVRQGRQRSTSRGVAFFLGMAPSLLGFVLLLWGISRVAAGLWMLLVLVWFALGDIVTFLGFKDSKSEL